VLPSTEVHISKHLLVAHVKMPVDPQQLEREPMLIFFFKITSEITLHGIADQLRNTLYMYFHTKLQTLELKMLIAKTEKALRLSATLLSA
jgi:hypothetical protein